MDIPSDSTLSLVTLFLSHKCFGNNQLKMLIIKFTTFKWKNKSIESLGGCSDWIRKHDLPSAGQMKEEIHSNIESFPPFE